MPITKVDPFEDRDLRAVLVWARAVLRRMTGIGQLAAPVRREGREPTLAESVDMLGDAADAVTALHKALAAVQRYQRGHPGTALSMSPSQLDDLAKRAKHARDAVQHLDHKMARSDDTQLAVNATDGITVVAPPGRSGATTSVARISWTEMEGAARECLAWAMSVGA